MLSHFGKITKTGVSYTISPKVLKNRNLQLTKNFQKFFSQSKTESNLEASSTINQAPSSNLGVAEEIQNKIKEAKNFEHFYSDEVDVAGVVQSLRPVQEENTSDIFDIVNSLSPTNIYEAMDHGSRDLLMYLTNDLDLGMGWGIILISLGIKFAFLPVMTFSQLNAIKMKLIDPEMKLYQKNLQKLQSSGDFDGMKLAQKQFRDLRDKYGISTVMPLLTLFQVPFLITWFLSLRYIANVPDKFPNIKTDGFLWFQDLSAYDPYFVLPLISACISSYNIQISSYNATSAAGSPMARFSRYFKYFPFLSMPIAVFFPAGINLYWICSAAVHLLISTTARSQAFRKLMGVPEYLPGTILERMHGTKKVEIVKTVFLEKDPSNKTEQAGGKIIQEKVQPVASRGSEKTVSVLSNKPKKK